MTARVVSACVTSVVLLLLAVAPTQAEEATAEQARARFLADRDAARLVASLSALTAPDAGTVTELALARIAARPGALEAVDGDARGYAALPSVVAAFRRMDLEAAREAASRVAADERSSIGAWADALVAVRSGDDARAEARLRDATAQAVGDADRAAFSLALLGVALPEGDRRLLAGAVRAAVLAAAARQELDRVERLGRLGASLDLELGADALRLAGRALARAGDLRRASALLESDAARRLPDSEGLVRLERALVAWELGRPGEARSLASAPLGAPGHDAELEALRAATAWPRLLPAPLGRPHAEGARRPATVIARLAGSMGAATAPEEVEARALALGEEVGAVAFAGRWLASRGLAVLEAAGDAELAARALEEGTPFLLYRLRPEDGTYASTPVLVRGRDTATGCWIADTADLEGSRVLRPDAPRKGRLLFAAPPVRIAPLEAWRDARAVRAGAAIAAALEQAEAGELTAAIDALAATAEDLHDVPVVEVHLAWLLHRRFLDAQDEAALARAAALVEETLGTPPPLAFEHLVRAQSRFFARDVPGSLAAFEAAERAEGRTATLARARFGVLLRGTRRYDEAIAAVDLALRLEPLDTEALYYRGTARARAGRAAAARADLRRALDRRPDSAVIALELAALELESDRPQAVIEVIDDLIADAPERAEDERLGALRRSAEGELVQAARSAADLAPFTRSPEPQTRRRVAFALASLQTDEAESLLRALLGDAEPAVRVTVLRIYMRPWLRERVLADDALTQRMLALLADDEAAVVRGAAGALLGLLGRPFAIEALAARLAGPDRDPDPYPRAAAAEALARGDGPTAREALVRALEDEDVAVRKAAVDALVRVAGTTLGYDPAAGAGDRAEAVGRWRAWLAEQGE